MRDGGTLRPVSWERALSTAASALKRAGERTAALVGGEVTNEEGFLVQHLLRDVLGSPHVDSRSNGLLDPGQARVLARPDFTAAVPDIDYAESILVLDTSLVDEAPILDLRVRKAVRRNQAKLVVASSRPGSLDPNAPPPCCARPRRGGGRGRAGAASARPALTARRRAGGARARRPASGRARRARPNGSGRRRAGRASREGRAARAGTTAARRAAAAEATRRRRATVILWGERLSHGERGRQAVRALLAVARRCGVAGRQRMPA